MDDIIVGSAIMAATGWAIFRVTMAASDRLTFFQQHVVAVLILTAMAGYGTWLWNRATLAGWLPFSNLIIVANWFPLFLLALAGVVIDMKAIWCWRRWTLLSVIVGFAVFAQIYPLLGSAPRCGQQWSRTGDCVQTTPFTCTAASAATLLKAYGIETSEQEMAELCLTRDGTSWMGLYRGLSIKTSGTIWKAEVVDCAAEDLAKYAQGAMIIDIGLPAYMSDNSFLARETGLRSGIDHSVVLWGELRTNRMLISDPAPHIGREEWHAATLRHVYRGRAIRIVERFPLPDHLKMLAAK